VPAQLIEVLRDRQLLRLDFSIFMLHAVMTANFVALPLVLRDRAGLPVDQHGLLYLAVVAASVVLMIPLIIVAEKFRRMKPVFLLSIGLLAVAELILWLAPADLTYVVGGLFLFFVGFNVLEATLPSLISKVAPAASKGSALGVYSTAQFMGAFVGGVTGGLLLGWGGAESLFLLSAIAIVIWGGACLTMTPPPHLLTKMVNIGVVDEQKRQQLTAEFLQIPGVNEAVLLAQESVAYLKVDSQTLDRDRLQSMTNKITAIS
ncbi:MAG: MFS transporter, partial [Gammaproteobacteria bacterium]